jgi:predicted MFS family arabinose efflux permease
MVIDLPAKVLLSLVAAYSMAYHGLDLTPLTLLDLSASRGLSTTAAGATVTCMTVAIAVSSAVCVRFVARPRRYRMARMGLLLGAVAFAAAAFGPATWMIPPSMVAGGIGIGMSIAAGSAALATTPNPDSTTSTVTFVNRVAAAGLLLVLPFVGSDLTITLGVLSLILLCASALVRDLPDAGEDLAVQRTNATTRVDAHLTRQQFALALFVGGGVFLWCVSEDMVYAITATVAIDRAGVAENYVGAVLSLSMLGGILGTVLALPAQRLLGRRASLVTSVLLGGVAKFALITATSPAVFIAAMSVWGTVYCCTLVYVISWAATIDVSGRASALVTSMYLAGFPLTPLIGGFLADNTAPLTFALCAAIPSLLVGALYYCAATWHNRSLKYAPPISDERALDDGQHL